MKNLFCILVIITIFVILYSCEKEIFSTTTYQNSGESVPQTEEETMQSGIKYIDMNVMEDDDLGIAKNIIFQSDLPDFQTAHVVLVDAEIEGDIMNITLSYSGGCRIHEFDLVSSTFKETEPVSVTVQLLHHKIDDPCDQWVTKTQAFNLSQLKEKYFKLYDSNCGQISISFIEASNSQSINPLTYEYEFCLDNPDFTPVYQQ